MSVRSDSPLNLPVGAQISALIFDLDGTLYFQGQLRRAILWQFLRAGLVRPLSTWQEVRVVRHYRRALEYLRLNPEQLASEQLRLACEWSQEAPHKAADAIAYWMEKLPLQILPRCLRPGMVGLLETARKRGIRLAVLSDYPATGKILAMGLQNYFSIVLSAHDARVGVFKPSPKGLNTLLEDLSVEPASTIYVGDRPSVDGEAAFRAGIASVILGQPLGRKGKGWIGVPDIATLRSLLAI